jgi:hypothetical protein
MTPTESANLAVVHRYFEGCSLGDASILQETLAADVVHYFLPPRFPPILGAERPGKVRTTCADRVAVWNGRWQGGRRRRYREYRQGGQHRQRPFQAITRRDGAFRAAGGVGLCLAYVQYAAAQAFLPSARKTSVATA